MKNRISKLIVVCVFTAIATALGAQLVYANETLISRPFLTDQSVSFILAVERDYPPFLFVDQNNQIQGISYDYTKLVVQKMGRELQTTAPLQLQEMLDAVKNGNANLLADITNTPERSTYLVFSDSYVDVPAIVIARRGDRSWIPGASNNGIKLGIGKSYGVDSYLRERYPDVLFIEFSSDSEVVRAVALGAIDVGVLDSASFSYILQKEPLSNIVVVDHTGFNYKLSFAVTKENSDILLEINSAIKAITPNERAEIYSKWQSILPQEKVPVVPRYLLIELIVLGAGTLLVILGAYLLRRAIRLKTKELQSLNIELDRRVNEKTKEAEDLKNKAEAKNLELERAQRAVLNILEDVQEEKAKLAAVSSRLKLATQSAKIGVWAWDIVKNIITWDDQMYTLYGIKKEDFGGAYEAWQAGLHPDDKKLGDEAIQMALRGEKDFSPQFRVLWPSGEIRYIQAHAIVERDTNGKPFKMIGVNWDITNEKNIDKAKTEFVSLASHQLRTPLSAINWYTEVLLTGNKGKFLPEQQDYLNEIARSNKRMIDLVDSLLNVSRLDLGTFMIDPVMTDIVALAKDVFKEIKIGMLEKKRQLNVIEKYDQLPQINVDPKLTRILFQNLLTNAVKYTPDGGTITLNVSQVKKDTSIDSYVVPQDSFMITVQDTGYGIPKDAQNRIFTKLFRADNVKTKDTDGNGLGLYIVKQITDHSSGKVWFVSEENKGTIFHVVIPMAGMVAKQGSKSLDVK